MKKIQTLEDTIESLRQQLVFTRTEEESVVPQKEVKKALLKQYGDNAEKPTSDRHAEFMRDLKIAEEQYLANYFSPIGSNIPTLSTDGFKITKPKK